ncbi:MAG: amidohydrolase family protein [Alphaproteobacteria bacterium]|nr:amidohydrolase family protein [Alphaproteobacteria bacterium]
MTAPLPTPSIPACRAPAGAVDCHHHVYDDRFALLPDATYRPGPATAAAYRRFRDRLGLARSVVIQPSVYGTDNACTLDAVAQLGGAAACAIVLIDDDAPRATLEALARGGAVGVRLQAVGPSRPNFARLERLAARVAELGWHLQLHLEPDLIVDGAARLAALRVPLVFDHFGRIPHPEGARHPAFAVLAGLVAAGRTWVKLSAGYHFSRDGAPGYADVGALTRAFLALAPERMLWGSDWPHPTETVKPDCAVLLDRFAEWAGSDATLRRVLVDNAASVYGFAPTGQGER